MKSSTYSEPNGAHDAAAPRKAARVGWAVGMVAAILAGLAVRGLIDGPVGQRGGEMMYAIMFYCAVNALRPSLPLPAAITSFAICFTVEAAQLSGIPARLGRAFPPVWLALGSEFTTYDLSSYLAGAALAAATHHTILRQVHHRTGARP